MSEQTKTWLIALAAALLPPVVDAVYQAVQAATATHQPIDWPQVATVALVALLGALSTTLRPRPGSEGIAAQVDALKAAGVHRRDMRVVQRGHVSPAWADDERRAEREVERRLPHG